MAAVENGRVGETNSVSEFGVIGEAENCIGKRVQDFKEIGTIDGTVDSFFREFK